MHFLAVFGYRPPGYPYAVRFKRFGYFAVAHRVGFVGDKAFYFKGYIVAAQPGFRRRTKLCFIKEGCHAQYPARRGNIFAAYRAVNRGRAHVQPRRGIIYAKRLNGCGNAAQRLLPAFRYKLRYAHQGVAPLLYAAYYPFCGVGLFLYICPCFRIRI